MTLSLILLTAVMAGFLGWLLRQSINMQPWRASPASAELIGLPLLNVSARRLGLGVLLAAITSFFALFLSAYLMRMHYPDWASLPKPGLLWINTGLLLSGSVALQSASDASLRGAANATRIGLVVGGLLTVGFIGGQWLVWLRLQSAGYLLAGNPANSFFYLLTMVHVVHLLGGLVAWFRPTARIFRGAALTATHASIELCAWYWHMLLVIWLVVFSVLLAT
jgi:cytochrome c oxidase subunit III